MTTIHAENSAAGADHDQNVTFKKLKPDQKKGLPRIQSFPRQTYFSITQSHSHSTEAGGLVVTSSTTRLAWGTSFTIRAETVAMSS